MHPSPRFKLTAAFSLFLILAVGMVFLRTVPLTTHAATAHSQRSQKSSGASAPTAATCGTWSMIPSVTSTYSNNQLSGVAVISANDVWAVGSSWNKMGYSHALIEDWNGTQWSISAIPSRGTSDSLNAVASLPTGDVWAVGSSTNKQGIIHVLIEYWDGSKWSIVSAPNPGSAANSLYGVTALASNDVWAVGESYNGSSYGNYYQTLIEHWNGSQWSVIPSPSVATINNYLSGIAAVSTSDVWAVGETNWISAQTLVEHWDGTQWSIVPSPNPYSASILLGAAATSTNDVWAVGGTLIEQWNGTQWNVVSNPGTGSLSAVAVVPGTNQVWAVGSSFKITSHDQQKDFKPIIEFYC